MTRPIGAKGTGREKWHGQITGYTYHGCRCAKCTKINREHKQKNRVTRQSKPIPEHVHGTTNGYSNYGCRCEDCKEAHTAAQALWRERQKIDS